LVDLIVVIVAGGAGKRLGSDTPKQYLSIGSCSVIEQTIRMFVASGVVGRFILVVHPDYQSFVSRLVVSSFPELMFDIVDSGQERQHSVANGLEKALTFSGNILIHDAARPFIQPETIRNCASSLDLSPAVVVGIKAKDTVKRITQAGYVDQTLNRSELFLAQTPQGFNHETAEKVLLKIRSSDGIGTDDVYFAEKLGVPVRIIEGSALNFKITTPEDLSLAKVIMENYGSVFA